MMQTGQTPMLANDAATKMTWSRRMYRLTYQEIAELAHS
jgi:hypothetical protein